MRFSIAAVAVLVLAVAAPAAGAQQQQQPERSIGVVGTAETFADNDIATFRLGVTVRRRTPGQALRAAGVRVDRVIGSLRASGVAREDIQTDVVSLSRTRSRRGARRLVYFARNSVTVIVRRLGEAGAVVDRAVRAGATNVFGPEFGVGDAREIYRRTLALAFAEARRKAERLAAESGVTLGPVLRIRESGFESGDDDSGGGADILGEVGQREAAATPIAPGRSRISAAVSVAFAIQ